MKTKEELMMLAAKTASLEMPGHEVRITAGNKEMWFKDGSPFFWVGDWPMPIDNNAPG